MNHHLRRGRSTGGRALLGPTVTHQRIHTRRQHRQRIRAALTLRARILSAHRPRQRIQPPIQHRRIRSPHRTPKLRQPTLRRVDLHMTVLINTPRRPLRGRIKLPNPPIHQLHDLAPRQPIPRPRRRRQPGINQRQHRLIDNQPGPKHHHRDHPEINLTGRHRRTQLRQPHHQLQAVIHLRGRPRPTDPQLRAHLRSHGLPIVDTPLRTVLNLHISHPHQTQPARRHQPPRHRRTLRPPARRHLRQQRRLIQRLEHTFDNRRTHRQKRTRYADAAGTRENRQNHPDWPAPEPGAAAHR